MKKIAILGTTPTRGIAPLDDKSWEIWTIGPGGMDSHRWDRLFELHRVWPEDFAEYLDSLSKKKRPVYTLESMPEKTAEWAISHGKDAAWLKEKIKGNWSSNVVIDHEKLFEKYARVWFSSSISYCLALAIEEGATDIGLYGIDLESGEEYISQYAGCKFFLDFARLTGINLHMPFGCGLERDLNPYPDRYETHLALTLEKKHKYLTDLLAQKEPEYENTRLELYRAEGRLLTLQELRGLPHAVSPEFKKWVDEDVPKSEQNLIALNGRVGQLAAAVNHVKGEQSATRFYQRMYVWGMTEPDD